MSQNTPARRASIDTQINSRNLFAPLPTADLDDDLIVCDPYSNDPPNRRSDKELARTLAILDSLEERGEK
jgi:hypothetical protein